MNTTNREVLFNRDCFAMKYNRSAIAGQLAHGQRFTADHLYVLDEVDSTNSWLLAQAPSHPAICVAEQQTAGRGRHGRRWVSDGTGSFTMSLRDCVRTTSLSGLSLVVGLCVRAALMNQEVGSLSLKWPNDLLLHGKKLGGILIESQENRVVIGIGINVSMPTGACDIDQPWADLRQSGYAIDINQLVADIVRQYEAAVVRFESSGFSVFQQAWNMADAFAGKPVELRRGKELICGIGSGVDVNGAVRIGGTTGQRSYFAGELSLA